MGKGRICRTCRWWDMYDLRLKGGECRAPGSGNSGVHRHGRVRMPGGTVALWDSFGPTDTKPNDTCGAWDDGALPPAPADVGSVHPKERRNDPA